MKKMLAILAFPVACFCSDIPSTPVVQERMQLDYIWKEIIVGDYGLAHYHLYKEKPSTADDQMYVDLVKMYLSILERDNKRFLKSGQVVIRDANKFFREAE